MEQNQDCGWRLSRKCTVWKKGTNQYDVIGFPCFQSCDTSKKALTSSQIAGICIAIILVITIIIFVIFKKQIYAGFRALRFFWRQVFGPRTTQNSIENV